MSAIYGSLWQTHFQILELTEIQRQKNDNRFASLLNRVRTGDQTDEDIALLNSRQTSPTIKNYPQHATHIFAYNRDVNTHNAAMLETLSQQLYTFTAKDSKRDEQTKRIEVSFFSDMAGGLSKTLVLGIGARVILTKNFDVSDGLVNSAAGTVSVFFPQPSVDVIEYNPKFILVRFDNERVGRKRREEHHSVLPHTCKDSTPISQVEIPIPLGKSKWISSKRTQFPHAWGLTIHKEQGKTEDLLVLSMKGSFHAGQFYTAISRTKTLEWLYIIDKVESTKIKVNLNSLNEIERMKREVPFLPPLPLSFQKSPDVYFKIIFLNINSLIPHFCSLMKDKFVHQSRITSLAETLMISSDEHPEIPNFNSLRCDQHNDLHHHQRQHRSGGLLLFIHRDFYLIKQYNVENVNIQYQMVVVSPCVDRTVRIAFLSVYDNLKNSVHQLLSVLERLLSEIPSNLNAFIVGNFNVDILCKSNSSHKLLNLFKYYGFHQLCKLPTYRRGSY